MNSMYEKNEHLFEDNQTGTEEEIDPVTYSHPAELVIIQKNTF